MKKLRIFIGMLLLLTIMVSCQKSKKGRILGGYCFKEFNQKEKEDVKSLWDGEVFTEVVLENGDTIHAAIAETELAERLAKNKLNVEVIIDGNNNDFYFIGR